MLDFRAVLSKLLYTFYSSENGFNHNLHIVFYVGFRNFRKTNTENQSVKNKKGCPLGRHLLYYYAWNIIAS